MFLTHPSSANCYAVPFRRMNCRLSLSRLELFDAAEKHKTVKPVMDCCKAYFSKLCTLLTKIKSKLEFLAILTQIHEYIFISNALSAKI